MLSVDHFRVRRGRRFALEISALDFTQGSVVLAGANGSGKSSYLAAVAGLLKFDGRAKTRGVNVLSPKGRSTISYLSQDPAGLEHLTLADALCYAASLVRRAPTEALMVADELGITARLNKRLGRMSSGERRLSYLALTLTQKPSVVLLDEPTGGIDAYHRSIIRQQIRRMSESSLVVTATHLPDDIEQLGDRTVVLRFGTIVFDGSRDELRRIGPQHMASGQIDAALAILDAPA